jgi:hypothetical protein
MARARSFLGSPAGLLICLVAAALGLYLLAFHLNHVALALPYLALLACPLMHFMHRGHHHHGDHHREAPDRDPARTPR